MSGLEVFSAIGLALTAVQAFGMSCRFMWEFLAGIGPRRGARNLWLGSLVSAAIIAAMAVEAVR